MISEAISYIAMALLAVTTLGVFIIYVKMRSVSNKLLALAGKEFHDRMDSILATSEELPDVALDYLSVMMRIAKSDNGPWQLFWALRKKSKGRSESNARELATALPQMRPELQRLFHDATVMWLNWMLNRNVLLGLLINFEFRKVAAERNMVDASPSDVERTVFSSFPNPAC